MFSEKMKFINLFFLLLLLISITLKPGLASAAQIGAGGDSPAIHGMLLVGVAAFGHWHLGDVNVPLVSGLLLGSVPGVWLGSAIASRIPEGALRPAVATLLFVTGVKLI